MQKEARFKELITHQQESGLTIKEFCSNQGIATATFHYWKKKLRKKPGRKEFIPLVIKTGSSHAPPCNNSEPGAYHPGGDSKALFELVFPNGTMLRIKQDLDLTHLRALIHLYD